MRSVKSTDQNRDVGNRLFGKLLNASIQNLFPFSPYSFIFFFFSSFFGNLLFHKICVGAFLFQSIPLLWLGSTGGFQLVKVNHAEIKALCIFAKVTFISSSGRTAGKGYSNYPMIEPWLQVSFPLRILLQSLVVSLRDKEAAQTLEIQFVHYSNLPHLFPSWYLAAACWHSEFQMPELQEAV